MQPLQFDAEGAIVPDWNLLEDADWLPETATDEELGRLYEILEDRTALAWYEAVKRERATGRELPLDPREQALFARLDEFVTTLCAHVAELMEESGAPGRER